jgi:hypothetical protein
MQVVFSEASAAAGHTIDRVISIMDADGLTLSKLTGFAQRVSQVQLGRSSSSSSSTASIYMSGLLLLAAFVCAATQHWAAAGGFMRFKQLRFVPRF